MKAFQPSSFYKIYRSTNIVPADFSKRRERDSNPRYPLKGYTPLAGERFRPLSHLSGSFFGLADHLSNSIKYRNLFTAYATASCINSAFKTHHPILHFHPTCRPEYRSVRGCVPPVHNPVHSRSQKDSEPEKPHDRSVHHAP